MRFLQTTCWCAMLMLAASNVQGASSPNEITISISQTNTPPPGTISLSWEGGVGPFQVLRASNLFEPIWENLGDLTTNRSITLLVGQQSAFFKVAEWHPDVVVGPADEGTFVLPTRQIVSTVGQVAELSDRAVDLALSPDGGTVYVKTTSRLVLIDTVTWRERQRTDYFPGSQAAMHGLAVSSNGSRIYLTGSDKDLYEYVTTTNGQVALARIITLPYSGACGIALAPNGTNAYVCLSLQNCLAVVNLVSGTVTRVIYVAIAPWDVVVSADGTRAYVSDLGGRYPVWGDTTAWATGTLVVVDKRGLANSGAVSFVDLLWNEEYEQVLTDLHPSDLELSPDGRSLYVANANSDTVSVIDTQSALVRETISVRPAPSLPAGSAANGLGLSRDGRTLFVANGGNNSIAVVRLADAIQTNSVVEGFIPTSWYPGAVITDATNLYVAAVKWLSKTLYGATWGRVERIPIPSSIELSNYTAKALINARVPEILATQIPPEPDQSPVPVPLRVGEPSVFQHVIYVIKENKTYDAVFGDLPQGNGQSNFCLFPRFVSPNHHALAEEFVLLDNYYCNGVLSVDGHPWAVQGNNSLYFEKSWGGFTRLGAFEGDPLIFASSGFIWNNVLKAGLSFRNYGEMGISTPHFFSSTNIPTWLQVYADYTNHAQQIWFSYYVGFVGLRRFSSTNLPGWNLSIPDVLRADRFIAELNTAQSNGNWPAFTLFALPNDHTAGVDPGYPTPNAHVADNDLALGRIVEAVSKSIFWSNTVIFVIEDDPQGGVDHVDGHRSLCLVISPYTHRHRTISKFYNQTSVLHTMEQILGLPPMNQMDAMSPLMSECFTNVPDFTPYTALPNNVPLDTMNPGTLGPLTAKELSWANKSKRLDFSAPDRADDDALNRIIWHAVKGEIPYPSKYAGAHGRGFKKLGLRHVKVKDDDD